jgi:hypothetical protein
VQGKLPAPEVDAAALAGQRPNVDETGECIENFGNEISMFRLLGQRAELAYDGRHAELAYEGCNHIR